MTTTTRRVSVSFEQALYTVAEGGAVEVPVTLSAVPERTVVIPITTAEQDDATSADYSGVALQRDVPKRRDGEDDHLLRHA